MFAADSLSQHAACIRVHADMKLHIPSALLSCVWQEGGAGSKKREGMDAL